MGKEVLPHAQKHIQAAAYCHKDHAQDPGSHGIGHLVIVCVSDGGTHFLVRRVVAKYMVGVDKLNCVATL
jgi:hypothetical protein